MPNTPPIEEPLTPEVDPGRPVIESKFRLVHIAARRAEQLVQGARPKMESRHVKPTRIALDEVHADLVRWALPGQIPVDERIGEGEAGNGGEPLADPLPLTEPKG